MFFIVWTITSTLVVTAWIVITETIRWRRKERRIKEYDMDVDRRPWYERAHSIDLEVFYVPRKGNLPTGLAAENLEPCWLARPSGERDGDYLVIEVDGPYRMPALAEGCMVKSYPYWKINTEIPIGFEPRYM